MAAGKRRKLYTSIWHWGQGNVRLLTPSPLSYFVGVITWFHFNTNGVLAFLPRERLFDNGLNQSFEVHAVADDTASLEAMNTHLHRVDSCVHEMPTVYQMLYDPFVDPTRPHLSRFINTVKLIDELPDRINLVRSAGRAVRSDACRRHGLERKGPQSAVTFVCWCRNRP